MKYLNNDIAFLLTNQIVVRFVDSTMLQFQSNNHYSCQASIDSMEVDQEKNGFKAVFILDKKSKINC